MADRIDVKVRWLIRRDVSAVLAIERASFADPWTEADLLATLRERSTIGAVAEADSCAGPVVLGFTVYKIDPPEVRRTVEVLNFAVAPFARRRGVGSAMTDWLARKIGPSLRREVVLRVQERNLDAQLFFRARGYRATGIVRDAYRTGPDGDGHVDAYAMRYARDLGAWSPVNRIARLTDPAELS